VVALEAIRRSSSSSSSTFHSKHDTKTLLQIFIISSEKKKGRSKQNMPQLATKLHNSTTIRRRFHHRVSLLRRCILRVLHRILLCSGRKTNNTYSMLTPALPSPQPPPPAESSGEIAREEMDVTPPAMFQTHDLDSDLVSLKISLLGDCQIGKTSFLVCI